MSRYQYDYTENTVAQRTMYDPAGRQQKANKIIAVLQDYWGQLDQLSLLDLSCSTGMLTQAFSPVFKKVYGIDIDQKAVEFAQNNYHDDNIEFQLMDALYTRFPDNTFNVIICNQMYEHVPDPPKLMAEIYRLLLPGGVCYFSATSRFKVIETHYGRIPFLSYLPKPLAHRYLRVLGKGDYYYETLYTYWGLKQLVVDFELIDYTLKVIAEPQRFHLTDMLSSHSVKQQLALVLLKTAYAFGPGYIWLLKKPLNE
ncbi:MAG: class I SAM-dependent methyltransferase [Pseudomonadota bacterium]|nr:class I SAM-dependent methyltransferase [Pseudomonadota bacterium]